MASPSFSGRRGPRPARKSPTPQPLDLDHNRLSRELEEIRRRELEIRKEQEEMQRKVADLPRQIEERERKQKELMRMRAVMTATQDDVFSQPRDKRYVSGRKSTSHRRMTRPEERSAKLQFLLLCVILAVFLFFLCKSLPH